MVVNVLGKNRNRVSIVADMLDAANVNSGVSKTHIMLKANLSFLLLEKYLNVVGDADLLKLEGLRYKVTERGHEFLKRYKKLQIRYSTVQELLDRTENELQKLANICDGNGFAPSIGELTDPE